jgi:hypothetical protein
MALNSLASLSLSSTCPFKDTLMTALFYLDGTVEIIFESLRHVSATDLHCIIPPGSLNKAMYSRNPDKPIWLESYKEEYNGLKSNDTFDIISEDEYIRAKYMA